VITAAGVRRLRSRRAGEPAVLSVYLGVPVDVAEHRGLPTRARELIKSAASQEPRGKGSQVSNVDVESIINAIDQNSQEWLGHTVAMFACSRIGLLETVPLPRSDTEQAVIADRPHIRPLPPRCSVTPITGPPSWTPSTPGSALPLTTGSRRSRSGQARRAEPGIR
jgi:hypothetical protein